jgi:type IV secretory pathway VirJ component
MHRSFLLFLTMALTVANSAIAAETVRHESDDFADLGRVDIIIPPTPPSDLVLLLDGGNADRIAQQLTAQGRLVARISLANLLANTGAHNEQCLYPATLLDVFSQHLQQKYRFTSYRRPALIGTGDGAGVIYATLAQASAPLFRTGIGIDFCPTLALPVPPCGGEGQLKFDAIARERYRLAPTTFATLWHAFNTRPACADAAPFGPSEVTPDLERQLNEALATTSTGGADSVNDLPLIELAATGASDYFVILLSGDGGWANIDKDIGNLLKQQGIPVVGWNSLQYFWTRKTPETASADLARTIRHYQSAWRRHKVVLVGFSLGADVLPFMISRLPPPERAAIADTVLLSLGHKVDFEFHVTDWLGGGHRDSREIAPELAKLSGPLLCVYGAQDGDTLCRDYRTANATIAALPGDHHFQGDFKRVTALILTHVGNNTTR